MRVMFDPGLSPDSLFTLFPHKRWLLKLNLLTQSQPTFKPGARFKTENGIQIQFHDQAIHCQLAMFALHFGKNQLG